MEETSQALKLGGVWQTRSFVSVISYLVIVAIFTWLIPKAFRLVDVPPSVIAAKPYIFRAEKYLYSDEDPEIILMGSSLVLRPSFESDRLFENLAVPKDEEAAREFKHRYTKVQHLRHLLQSCMHRSFDVINLGVPSCMTSDYYLILQKLMDFGKHPHLIVLAVAPRDFLDNKYPDFQQTPSVQLMSTCIPVRKWTRHPMAAVDYCRHFFAPFAWAEKLFDAVTVRSVSTRLDFELNPDGAGHKLVDAYRRSIFKVRAIPPSCEIPQSAKKYFDLDAYNWCYNPPNMEGLRQQFLYLEKFVTLASRKDIPVVLVDMPLTVENQALIQPSAQKTYKDLLHQLAKNNSNVLMVDANRLSGCTAQDFVDSAHLNGLGGHKCFECIAKAISANSLLRAKLCSVQGLPQL
jgi:hypothetical protein